MRKVTVAYDAVTQTWEIYAEGINGVIARVYKREGMSMSDQEEIAKWMANNLGAWVSSKWSGGKNSI